MTLFFTVLLLPILLFLEASVIEWPLVLVFLICLAAVRRDETVFFFAIISGILLDLFLLRPVGATAIFFITSVFVLLLYRRKFEIASYYFVILASFIISFVYAALLSASYSLLQAVIGGMLSVLFFSLIQSSARMTDKPREHSL